MEEEKKPLEQLKERLETVKHVGRTESGVGRYLHLGMTFTLSILLFLYGGYRLDGYLGTLPIFTLSGPFLGGLGGFLYIYRELVADGGRDDPK